MLKKTGKNKKRGGAAPPLSFAPSVGVGLAVCVVSLIVTALLLSALLLCTDDPDALIIPAAIAVFYISAMSGGAAASLLRRGDCGASLCVGGSVYLIILILSLILPAGMGEKIGTLPAAALVAPMLLFAFLGGLAVTSALTKKRKHPHRRR